MTCEHRGVLCWRKPALVVLAVGFLSGCGDEQASRSAAACDAPAAGIWRRDVAEMNEVTRIEVREQCAEARLAGYRVRAFARCFPRDCTWSWTEAIVHDPRNLSAIFATFSAVRGIEIRVNLDRMDTTIVHNYLDDDQKDVRYRATFWLE